MATKIKMPPAKSWPKIITQLIMLAASWEMVRERLKDLAQDDAVIGVFVQQANELMKFFTTKTKS